MATYLTHLDDLSNGRTLDQMLAPVLQEAAGYLQEFATAPDFSTKMHLAFGDGFDAARANALVKDWAGGNLPKIEIRAAAEINGANGAYAKALNTIFISQEFLHQNAGNLEAVTSVLLEEIGHAVDAQLNQSDSPGDEGAIFSALLRGEALTSQQLASLKAEDDTATATLNGQVVQLEQARFDGTLGNDFREGTSGSDLFLLGAGNDVAYGDNRSSWYYGDDTLYGEDGNDLLHGEYPTADQSSDRGSNDYLDGGNGDDTLDGDSIFTRGNDTLLGRNGNDVLFGYGNPDFLDGGEGNDYLNGGDGSPGNTLLGGIGDDILVSGVGNDRVDGGEGIDFLSYAIPLPDGGVTVNLLTGIVTGVAGTDTVTGIEIVAGSEFSDTLTGSDGNDSLHGWFGNDILEGGFGDDTLIGDNGNDTASYESASSSVTVNLETGIATGGAGTDILNSIEGVNGSNFNDSLIGNTANNTFDGREGDDYLQSGSGNDSLVGNTGNDTLKGELGDDSLYGLAGNDYLDGGEGNDYLYGESDRDTNDSGNDTLQGGVGKDFLYGWGGDDLLDGGDGDDYLYGEPNSSATQVQSGNDTLLGGAGKDYLHGGDGNDILDGGEGDDRLEGSSVNQIDGSNDNDTLLGGAGNDFLYSDYQSSNGNDYLDGGDGDDYVEGGGGNDTLIGSSGADQLSGDYSGFGTGNDSLNGGDGADNLNGGYGIDTLSGGADNDVLEGGGDYFNPGIDWVSESADTNFTLTDNQLTGLGIDTLSSIERANLRGGDSNNVLDASAFTRGGVILSGEGGNDTLKGGSSNDTLIGVNSSSLNPGLGELDILVGSSGADSFILGDATWLGYDDRNTATNGSNDYAIIADFSPTEDIIQLQGPKTNYRLDLSGANTNLYIDKPESEPDELIAVIQGVTGLDINSKAFVFVEPINDTVPGTLAFSAASYSVNEDGIPIAAITLTRTGGSDGAVSVTVNSTDGTATAPGDYNNTPILVNFANGEINKVVNIPIVNDTLLESNETINLSLSNPTGGATVGNQNTATLTIVDNEMPIPGSLAFSAANYSVNEDGTTTAAVTVTRTGGSDGAVSVTVNPTDGTATAPDDYNNTPIVVDFANGETSQTVNIPIFNDAIFEQNETVNLSLTNPTNGATIGTQNTATLTIVENDVPAPGSLSFSTTNYSVNEDETPIAAITLTRTGGSDGAVSVTLNSSDGTATASNDYNNTPIVVNFANGETSQTVNIPIVNDAIFESNETVNLSLTNPTNGATIGTQNTATLTIVDNDVNNAPNALDDSYSVDEDNTLTIAVTNGVLANDTDPDGDTLTVTQVNGSAANVGTQITLASDALLTLNANGTFDYNPNSQFEFLAVGESTADTFAYTIDDSHGNTSTATVTLTINGANDKPVAADDTATTNQNTPLTIPTATLLSNDSDPDGDILTLSSFSNATNGSVALDQNGDVVFTPATDFLGQATFDYTVSDSNNGIDIAQVTVTVNPVIDPPLILIGGDGDDFLTGGGGKDTIDGGKGQDVIFGGNGNDFLLGGLGNDFLTGDGGKDTIDGGKGQDVIFGGNGNDFLIGGLGNDFLTGDGGKDTIDGGKGQDVIFGGNGNDFLIGGLGNDFLTGGGGNDQFVYRNFSDRTDQIIDFTPGSDLLVLTEVFTHLGYSGTNPMNDGYMQLVESGANTLVQIDPDGVGLAALKTLVTLQNVSLSDLNANSFLL